MLTVLISVPSVLRQTVLFNRQGTPLDVNFVHVNVADAVALERTSDGPPRRHADGLNLEVINELLPVGLLNRSNDDGQFSVQMLLVRYSSLKQDFL